MIVKRQNKPNDRNKIPKMRDRLENGDLKANCGTTPVEIASAVIQTIAATAQKIFFLTRTDETLRVFAPKEYLLG